MSEVALRFELGQNCRFQELEPGQHFCLGADPVNGAERGELYCKLTEYNEGRSGCDCVRITDGKLFFQGMDARVTRAIALGPSLLIGR